MTFTKEFDILIKLSLRDDLVHPAAEPRKLHSMEIQSKFKQPILVKELERVHDNFLKNKHNNSDKEYCKAQERLDPRWIS